MFSLASRETTAALLDNWAIASRQLGIAGLPNASILHTVLFSSRPPLIDIIEVFAWNSKSVDLSEDNGIGMIAEADADDARIVRRARLTCMNITTYHWLHDPRQESGAA